MSGNDSKRPPITEADLHAYADGRLAEERRHEVDAYLAAHSEDAARVAAWMRDNVALRELLDPVLEEPIPIALAARRPAPARRWRQLALAASIAAISASAGWMARDALDAPYGSAVTVRRDAVDRFAHRAAIAHVVYSPDARRPVEVAAAQEDQLVAWLSKRLGAPLRPPHLAALGYELIGGRLLPGSEGPVAQFMYHDAQGQRLTLYVTREMAGQGETAFRFASEGPVNVFYWVDGRFGYALSAGADRSELQRIAHEVYRQLAGG